MFCVKCGANLPDGTAFCPNCGQPVMNSVPVANNEQQPLNQIPTNTSAQEPINNAPVDNAPVNNAPMGNGFMNNTPVDNTPATNAPMGNGFMNNTPVDNAPANNAPMGNGFMNNTPVDNAPANNAPMGNGFMNNTPVDNTHVNNAPMGNSFMNNTPNNNAPMGNSFMNSTPNNNAPMGQYFSSTPTTASVENTNKSSNKTKLIVFISIAAIAAILIVVLVIFLLKGSDSGSYTDTLNKAIMTNQTANLDDAWSIIPRDVLQKTLDESSYADEDEMKEALQDTLNETVENFEDSYGKGFTITYEIRDEEFCTSKSDLEELTDAFQDQFDSKATITSAAKIKVREKYDGPDDKDTYTDTYYLIQIDGKWYLDSTSICTYTNIDFK